MLKFLRLTAAPSVALLVLMAGCSTSQPQATSPSPTPIPSFTPPPAPSPIASAAPSPLSQTDPFQDASDKAISATTISQSAQSKNDWDSVAVIWQETIDLMKAVPTSSPNYTLAQKKIPEYQHNLVVAQQNSINLPSPTTVLTSQNVAPQSETQTDLPGQVAVAKAPSYQIKGALTLVDSNIEGTVENCSGTGGYEDIQAGMQVTVKDGKGNIIATGQTETGKRPLGKFSSVTCVFSFQLNNVPKSDFYSIEVGHRGQLNYSYEQMQQRNWEVMLSLD